MKWQLRSTQRIPTKFRLDFDFLDAGDGVIVEVISEATDKPSFLGTVRGARVLDYGQAELDSYDLAHVRSRSKLGAYVNEHYLAFRALIIASIILASVCVCFTLYAAVPRGPDGPIQEDGGANWQLTMLFFSLIVLASCFSTVLVTIRKQTIPVSILASEPQEDPNLDYSRGWQVLLQDRLW